jgi:hypothetical protein
MDAEPVCKLDGFCLIPPGEKDSGQCAAYLLGRMGIAFTSLPLPLIDNRLSKAEDTILHLTQIRIQVLNGVRPCSHSVGLHGRSAIP